MNRFILFLYIYISVVFISNFYVCNALTTQIKFSRTVVKMPLNTNQNISLIFIPSYVSKATQIKFLYRNINGDIVNKSSQLPIQRLKDIQLAVGSVKKHVIPINTVSLGEVLISATCTNIEVDCSQAVLQISIMRYSWLEILQKIIGWIYFIAWTISFYPQIIENFRRKSVVGLNFDFLALNLLGFVVYSCFTVSLYFSTYIKQIYIKEHNSGSLPVEVNDVFFCLHAIFIVLVTIVQCFIYERGGQKISKIAWTIIASLMAYSLIVICLGGTVLNWLNVLYYISYVKIVITIIKYIPQVLMNYRRKSTVGWSTENTLLDLTGGTFSNIQMFIIAYNFDDKYYIVGNPTKLFLGLVSIAFDIVLFAQFLIYRKRQNYVSIDNPDNPDSNSQS